MHNKNPKRAFTLTGTYTTILIIILLIIGATQGDWIVTKIRLNDARNITKNSPVLQIKGLIAWWESTSKNSFIVKESKNGAKISSWYSMDPSLLTKNDIIQLTDIHKPIYLNNAINGLPAVKFNGTSSFLELPYNPKLNQKNFTIFAVVKTSSSSDYGAIFSSRSDPPKQGYVLYNTPAIEYEIWIGNSETWGTPANSRITINRANILSADYNGNFLNFYDNGKYQGYMEQTISLNERQNFRIGAGKNENKNPEYFYDGYIGEIIIFERVLTTEERKMIESYLSQKWKIGII
jgi:hypothetical protein